MAYLRNEQACAALSILCESDRGKSVLAACVVGEGDEHATSAEVITNSMRNLRLGRQKWNPFGGRGDGLKEEL